MADVILSVGIDSRQLSRELDRSLSKTRKLGGLNVASVEQPLGRITGKASEFNKSLEASNARVIAFGASAGAIFAVRAAFDKLVTSTIEVENQLTEINTLLGLNARQLQAFSTELLGAANTAGVSFENASKAAQEFARQGLSAEETIKRTADALALARLSGVDFGDAVSSLTAIVNSFKNEALSTTEVVERLAEVDAKFAITASGIAEALKRVGSSAEDANITLNQTIALITAAQQVTGRGEAIIGNAFKTIFTRVQRPQVLSDLESIGVLTRDAAGDILPIVEILKNLASTYDSLSASEKSFVSENVASVYQINTLKAVLGDLGSGFSFYNQALKTAENSSGAAKQRLEELNETLATKLVKSLNSVTVASASLGNVTLGKSLGGILDFINRNAGEVAGFLNPQQNLEENIDGSGFLSKGKDFGENLFKGVLAGAANILAGPGTQALFLLMFKLFDRLAKFAGQAIGELGGISQKNQTIKALEKESLEYLKQNPQVLAQINAGVKTVAQVHDEIIQRIRTQNTLLKYQFDQAQAIARLAYASGISAVPATSARQRTFSTGHVPNYDAQMMEKMGALAGGYQPGMIKQMQIAGLGNVVYNSAEKVTHLPGASAPYISPPENSSAGRAHRQESLRKNGIDPYTDFSAGGLIPNFAHNIRKGAIYNLGAKQVRVIEQVGENWRVKHHDFFEKIVSASDLELANISQVKSYMRWRDARGRYVADGLVPNFALAPLQTALKDQPKIPDAEQYKKLEEAVARAIAAGPREITSLPKEAFPEGRPKAIHLTDAQSGALYRRGVTRDKIDAARKKFDQPPWEATVEDQVKAYTKKASKIKSRDIQNTVDDIMYDATGRFTMFSDRVPTGVAEGKLNDGRTRDLDRGTFVTKFNVAKLKDKFDFTRTLEPKIEKAYYDAYDEIGFSKEFGIFKAETFKDSFRNVSDKYGALFGSLFDGMIRQAVVGSSGTRDLDALGTSNARFDVKKSIPILDKLFDIGSGYEQGDFKFGDLTDNAKSMAQKIQKQWAEETAATGDDGPRVTRKVNQPRTEEEKKKIRDFENQIVEKFGQTSAIAALGLVPNFAESNEMKNINFVQGLFKQKFGNLSGTGEGYIDFSASPEEFLKKFEKSYLTSRRVEASLFGVDTGTDAQVAGSNARRNDAYERNLFKRFSKYKARGRFAGGYVPNLMMGAIGDAVNREMAAGYSRSEVKVGYDPRLSGSGGIGVYNTDEGSLRNAINLHMAMGKTIGQVQDSGKGAAKGMVPNLAFDDFSTGTGFSNITNQLSFAFAAFINQGDKAGGIMDKLATQYSGFLGKLGSSTSLLGKRMSETIAINNQKIELEKKEAELASKKERSREAITARKEQGIIDSSVQTVEEAKEKRAQAIRGKQLVGKILSIKDVGARANEINDINTNPLRKFEKAQLQRFLDKTSRSSVTENSLRETIKLLNAQDANAQLAITKADASGSDATVRRDSALSALRTKFKGREGALAKQRTALEGRIESEALRREELSRGRQQTSSRALKGSLAISGIGGIGSQLLFGDGRSQAKAAFEGVTSGLTSAAQVLTAFPGPVGKAISGFLVFNTIVSAANTALNEYSETLIASAEFEKGRTQKINTSVDGYIRSLSSLQEAYTSNTASTDTITKLQNKLSKELASLRTSGVSEDKIRSLQNAVTPEEKLRVASSIQEDRNKFQETKDFSASFAVDLEKKLGQRNTFGKLAGIVDSLLLKESSLLSSGAITKEERLSIKDAFSGSELFASLPGDDSTKNIFDKKFANKGFGEAFLNDTTSSVLGGFSEEDIKKLNALTKSGQVSNLSTLNSLFGEKNERLGQSNNLLENAEARNQFALSLQKESLLREIAIEANKKHTEQRKKELETLRISQQTMEGLRRKTLSLNAALLTLASSGLDNFNFGTRIDNKALEGRLAEQSIRNQGALQRSSLFGSEANNAVGASAATTQELLGKSRLAFNEIEQQGRESIAKIVSEALPKITRDASTGNIQGSSQIEREGAKLIADSVTNIFRSGKNISNPLEFQKELGKLIDKSGAGEGARRAANNQLAQIDSGALLKNSLDNQRSLAQKALEEAQALSQEAAKMNEQLKLIATQTRINFGGGIKSFLDRSEGRNLDRDIRRGARQAASSDPIRAGRGALQLGLSLQKFTGGQLDKTVFAEFRQKAITGVQKDLDRRISNNASFLSGLGGGGIAASLKNVNTRKIATAQVDEALKLNDTQIQIQNLKSIDGRMGELVQILSSQGIKVNWQASQPATGVSPNAFAETISQKFSSGLVPLTSGVKDSVNFFVSSIDQKIGEFLKANEKGAVAAEKEIKNQQKLLDEYLKSAQEGEKSRHKVVLDAIEEMLKKLNKPIEDFSNGLSSLKSNNIQTVPKK